METQFNCETEDEASDDKHCINFHIDIIDITRCLTSPCNIKDSCDINGSVIESIRSMKIAID